MKENFKTILMYFIKVLLTFLKIIPIKKYIMFCTNSGAGYYCNPKYIYISLSNNPKFSEYKFIWCFKNPEEYEFLKKQRTIICKYRSLKYYYYKVVSKVYISNSIEGSEVPKKRRQIRIQTWHGGGAYKKVALAEKEKSNMYKKRTENNINNTSAFISSSELFSNEVIKNNFCYNGEIIEAGMPRNDILFDKEKHSEIRKKVLEKYNINDKCFVVLYAPTWRYDESKLESINFENLKNALKEKYNKEIVIIYRAHLHMEKDKIEGVIPGTNYEDMQELLIASDMLISDYSSSIWDYSFLKKPCILFCPDLEYYIKRRGFVIDIDKWGFPIAKNNEELRLKIKDFDEEKFEKKMDEHHNMLKSYEEGHACEIVANYLERKLK